MPLTYASDLPTPDLIAEATRRAEVVFWALHRRLGEPYDSARDQIHDGQLLGRVADVITSLRAARSMVDTLVLDERCPMWGAK